MRLLLAAALLVLGSAAERKPNVLVILTDDQGWGDLSLHGNTNLATPAVDSIARDGAQVDRFFVQPVCSPTRAEFFTGRWHLRGGVRNVTSGGERLNLDERSIAEHFKAAGYATGAFGKWHNGSQHPYHPNDRGFDEYYGFTSGHWGDYYDALLLDHNGRSVRGKGFLPDEFADRAIDFISANKDRPFFCYVPFNTPHSPLQVPDRWFEKFAALDLKLRDREPKQEDLAATRAVLAMCENLDWNVGRLLRKLDELNLAKDTIVVYFHDNGPNGRRWNGGMKGRKGSTDEGGVRSPLLLRWAGRIPAGTRVRPIAGAVDLLPTLADLAGVAIPAGKPLDGISLKPWLTGETPPPPERMLLSHWAGKFSVRSQRFRLDSAGKLFDLEADPGQDRDVAGQHPDEVSRLTKTLERWKSEMTLKQDDRAFTVSGRSTYLPARDGVPKGGVKRSSRAPNCSYFTNWTRPEDRITWDIEVAAAGKYDVVVYYACPKDDVGSRIELSFRGSRLEASLTEPHDPPAYGPDHDRAPRDAESPVKDFKPWRMGSMDLPAGRGELSLRALTVARGQVMEVRQIELIRTE
ncbi:MAG TPA: sulfatase-like hydrolase/transferase [Planctomycetota bacterium]|jgi:arylsulfatase A-like enzyme|nr:sulfatase-like hydrolase/transferase [Planctomycetota bacterium]